MHGHTDTIHMVDEGDIAPDFTAPLAKGDIEPFTLSENIGNGPLVLAFFPGAFTSTCTEEMCTFRDEMASFNDIGAEVYGVSVDTPFSLNEFRDQYDLTFGILSDHTKEIIDAYEARMDFADMGYYGVAKRSVFVVDEDGRITYKWIEDDPGIEPNYDEVEQAAAEAAE